jgi:hypothetical protein
MAVPALSPAVPPVGRLYDPMMPTDRRILHRQRPLRLFQDHCSTSSKPRRKGKIMLHRRPQEWPNFPYSKIIPECADSQQFLANFQKNFRN